MFCGQVWKNSICSNILNGCERGKIEITKAFTQGREKKVMVIEINNRLRCQGSTRAEAALKWVFDGTADSNCKLFVKCAERLKEKG